MSIARRLLGLPEGADDGALLGVRDGASRRAIIEAGRARLAKGSALGGVSAEELKAYREEIQAAAYRLVSGLPSPSRGREARAGTGTRAALVPMVLMRRDPRRARLFLAAARRSTLAPPLSTHAEGEPIQLDLGNPEDQQRAPWGLLLVVVISLIVLIAEIVTATRGAPERTPPTPPPPETAPAGPTPAPDASRTEGAPQRDPQGQLRGAVATEDTANPAPTSPPSNEAARALRQRWQRAASAAIRVTDLEIGPLDPSRRLRGDPLGSPLRQAMLVERLVALHAAALWLIAGDDEQAARLLDTLPDAAVVSVPASPPPTHPTAGADDGQLEIQLKRMSGPTEARAAVLRTYRTRPNAPGPLDARTLVHEALKGPSRALRSLARTVLIERGRGSLDTAEAVEERFAELTADPACSGLLRAISGVDPQGSGGSAATRAALLTSILVGRGSRLTQIDESQRALEAALGAALRAQGGRARVSGSLASRVRDLAPSSTRGTNVWSTDIDSGALHALVENLTALLHMRANELSQRRPSDARAIHRAVVDASQDRAMAESALAQAIANARGLLEIDSFEMGVTSPRAASPEDPTSTDHANLADAVAPPIALRWKDRLESLDPSRPREYLELAEEVFASVDAEGARVLARQLASLAGVLGDRHTIASAALLLAALEDGPSPEAAQRAAQWRAIARRHGATVGSVGAADVRAFGGAGAPVRQAVVDAIAQFRRGYGRRVEDRLKDAKARTLFDRVISAFPGGATEFGRLADEYVKGTPPPLSSDANDALLRLERALVLHDPHSWADALVLGEGNASVDAPLGSAQEVFGVDPAQCYWRVSGWRRAAAAASPAVSTPSVPGRGR